MRQMKLGLFLAPGGHHMAAWRHPDAYPDGVSVKTYMRFAQIAELVLSRTRCIACPFERLRSVSHRKIG